MSMIPLLVKGGYGEHGRSCFLFPFRENRYAMLDCGIMDTDPNPYPQVEPELLEATEYLFLSHCHKDHSGAFQHFRKNGFSGWLVTTVPTIQCTGIDYEKTILLGDPKEKMAEPVTLKGGISFFYGRTGHCAGSIWLHLFGAFGSLFYSGDYQRRALAYAVDPVAGRQADLAILDCAHVREQEDGDGLRKSMADRIEEILQSGSKVLMPLPKYGRGLEVILMLRRLLPNVRIGAEENMVKLTRSMVSYAQWIRPDAVREIEEFLAENPQKALADGAYDVLLIGDTHLERQENRSLVLEETKKGALTLLTGRVKAGCATEQLLKEGKAFTMAYPHHQSRKDFVEMMEENNFRTVLPFHNNRKEVFWKP